MPSFTLCRGFILNEQELMCEEGHEWSGLIANRAGKGKADPGCPYCSGRKRPERPIRLD